MLHDVANALASVKSHVEKNILRRVSGKLSDYVRHIYVDASFEPSGYSGLGGVMYASTGECLGFLSEKVDDGLLSGILAEDHQKTVIQELEALALLIDVVTLKEWLSERRAVAFTDSESAKGAFLKSWSQNQNCSKILLAVFELEEDLQAQLWVERVPCQRNPADYLSREEVQEFAQIGQMRCDTHKVWDELVLGRGASATNMVRD